MSECNTTPVKTIGDVKDGVQKKVNDFVDDALDVLNFLDGDLTEKESPKKKPFDVKDLVKKYLSGLRKE